jgi:zinc protease
LLPTEQPYVYTVSATVAEGRRLDEVEGVLLAEIDRLATAGVTDAELAKARAQLRARFVYDADSVTDIAHQLGYFQTIAGWRRWLELEARLEAVTVGQVQAVAARYLSADNRTIGWFEAR